MRKYRVSRRNSARGPRRWGVQVLDGYTDGRPSWRLATRTHFRSREAAEAWIAERAAVRDGCGEARG
jgi:hypothetical protein